MKGILVGLAIAFAAVASAQDSKRMQVIWAAAENRLNDQTDLWFEKGEFPRSVQGLRILYGINSSDYEIATNLGWMLENIERWEEALGVYIDFRKKNPKNPDAAYPEAYYHYQKRAYAKIPPLLEPSLKMKKKPHTNSYRVLAQAYERLGRFSESKRTYTKLLQVLPNDGATLRNIKRVEGKMKGTSGGAKRSR